MGINCKQSISSANISKGDNSTFSSHKAKKKKKRGDNSIMSSHKAKQGR